MQMLHNKHLIQEKLAQTERNFNLLQRGSLNLFINRTKGKKLHDVNGATDYWRESSVLHSFLPSLQETIATHIIQEMGDQNVTSSGAINPSTNPHNFVQDWCIFPRFCIHSRAENTRSTTLQQSLLQIFIHSFPLLNVVSLFNFLFM